MPWPPLATEGGQGARRAAGAAVVLVDGHPVLFLDRDGRRLRTFAGVAPNRSCARLPALRDVARGRPRGALTLEHIDDVSAIAVP